ncbi:hypothetical protein [Halolamina salifodinae]|uniref:Uncharacterized protein n=1 Tax=Halolamina salifodinae TaxID=1202767 RepID=A0A8T4GYE0_9EURY|nr:hypothetical protein [Halolamina salifodinae]MBP1987252.1 hypothetical protein [Halolamina salifodinae]
MDDDRQEDDSDSEYPPDVHGYVRSRLDREGLNTSDHPREASDLIEKAASDYIVFTDASEIEDYEYHYITAVRIATMIGAGEDKFQEQAEEFLSSIPADLLDDEAAKQVAESAGRFTIGNNVTLVYSMAYEFVDDMLEHLLPEVLSDDVDDGTGNVLVSQIQSYPGRADLLAKAGIIDDETRNGVRHIREIRRDLVHDVEERFTLSPLEDLDRINDIPTILDKLYELVYDQSAYQYVDE